MVFARHIRSYIHTYLRAGTTRRTRNQYPRRHLGLAHPKLSQLLPIPSSSPVSKTGNSRHFHSFSNIGIHTKKKEYVRNSTTNHQPSALNPQPSHLLHAANTYKTLFLQLTFINLLLRIHWYLVVPYWGFGGGGGWLIVLFSNEC